MPVVVNQHRHILLVLLKVVAFNVWLIIIFRMQDYICDFVDFHHSKAYGPYNTFRVLTIRTIMDLNYVKCVPIFQFWEF